MRDPDTKKNPSKGRVMCVSNELSSKLADIDATL